MNTQLLKNKSPLVQAGLVTQIEHIKCLTDAIIIQFPRALIHNPSSRGYHMQRLSQDSDTSSQLLDHIKKSFNVRLGYI